MLIQKILKFDSVVSLLLGLILFLFPSWILKLFIVSVAFIFVNSFRHFKTNLYVCFREILLMEFISIWPESWEVYSWVNHLRGGDGRNQR